MKAKMFFVAGLAVACILAILFYGLSFFPTKLSVNSAHIPSPAYQQTVATNTPTPRAIDVFLEVDKTRCEPAQDTRIVYVAKNSDHSSDVDNAERGYYSQPVAVESSKSRYSYYPQSVAVESKQFREKRRRTVYDRVNALKSEDRRLGQARFERILSSVNHSEIARIQAEHGFAMR